MIFFATYECFPDKKEQAQSFFANMSVEQIANEVPPNVTLLARYHDVPNGTGITILAFCVLQSQQAILGCVA